MRRHPTTLFFFKIVLAIQGPMQFHMNLRISFSVSVKKAVDVLIEITLNLQVAMDHVCNLLFTEAHVRGKNVDTLFLDTSKPREWFPLGMEGFSLGRTKELRRDTQGTSIIPVVFYALKKNWKQTLLKLSPLNRWQMDVCYFALCTCL